MQETNKAKVSIFTIIIIILLVGQGIKLLKKLTDKPSQNNNSSSEKRKILREQIIKDQNN
jgi:hypothetical protein